MFFKIFKRLSNVQVRFDPATLESTIPIRVIRKLLDAKLLSIQLTFKNVIDGNSVFKYRNTNAPNMTWTFADGTKHVLDVKTLNCRPEFVTKNESRACLSANMVTAKYV